MTFNPLLDSNTTPTIGKTWWEVVDDLSSQMVRALKANDHARQTSLIQSIEFIDAECAGYWRDVGQYVYTGRLVPRPAPRVFTGIDAEAGTDTEGAGESTSHAQDDETPPYNPLLD